MRRYRQATAVITALMMLLGTASYFRQEAALTVDAVEVWEDWEVYPDQFDPPSEQDYVWGTTGILFYYNYGDHIEITGCDNAVDEIEIPAEIDGLPVTAIGDNAFGRTYWMEGLLDFTDDVAENTIIMESEPPAHVTSVILPDTIQTIGKEAFANCPLMEIVIPESVVSIGDEAFHYCSKLESVTLSDNTKLGRNVFSDTPWMDACFAENGFFVHAGTLLELSPEWQTYDEITIPEGVTAIGDYVFAYNRNVRSVTLPEGVTSIGESAFSYCQNLDYVSMPESLTAIGDNAFQHCRVLLSAEFPEGMTSIGAYAFDGCGQLNTLVLPDSVTEIGAYAFRECECVPEVHIPAGLTEINAYLFAGCRKLVSVTLPESVTSVGEHAFWDCESLESVYIPDSVTTIGDSAFTYCSALSSVTLPEYLTSLGDYAFQKCTNLTDITIGEALMDFGAGAFWETPWLEAQYDVDGYCIINTVLISTKEENLKGDVILPDGLTVIGKCAFYTNSYMTSVTIPKGVTYIDRLAFRACYVLKKVNIPDTVTGIGASAFYRDAALERINIPESVTYIGNNAFESCMKLNTVLLPGSVTKIGKKAFYECTNLTSAVLSEGTAEIGNEAFGNCGKLTAVTIPKSVSVIGYSAFYRCALSNVYYAGTEDDWNAVRFFYASNEELEAASLHFNSTGELLYGDVDCNGQVDLIDVIMLNSNLMSGRLLSAQGIINADVDGNGVPDQTDSLNILKYVVKIIETFPLTEATE